MKKYFLGIIFSSFTLGILIGGAYINKFQGSSNGNDIVIEWWTGVETDLDKFVIERTTLAASEQWGEIGTIEPKGNNSYYKFVDESAYKTADVLFKYRLKIVDNDGTVSIYSETVSVSHNISDVRRTWGSIKAMFR